MKKTIPVIVAIIVLLLCSGTAFAAEKKEICLISQDTDTFYVVIPSKADIYEKYAAKLLCEKLSMIYDINAKTASDNEKMSGKVVSVGKTVYCEADFTGKKSGSYELSSFDNGVCIDGIGNRGLIDGVYRFLNEFCGYEVYTKDVISYTGEKTLTVPTETDIEYSPYFEYRRIDTASCTDGEYAHANSLNSDVPFENYEGGMIDYLSYYGHTLGRQFCDRDVYFNEHPEYFALRDGERVSTQLCLTNPDVLKIVTDEVLDLIKLYNNPEADLQIVSLTQCDNKEYCMCERCAALDEANSSQAGTMITFVNAVAAAVKAAGYDNVAIDTFAYQYTRHCPTNVVPVDNVIVRLCSIECCCGHTIDNAKCGENAEFMKDLDAWSKICGRLYIWEYVNNYSETLLPYADFQVLQRNIQVYAEHGAKGMYAEGNYYMDICNGEFYELRSYLISKLMQNPYRNDYYELMDNYLVNVYGPGGLYLRQFIDLITEHSVTNTKHLHIRQQPSECLPGMTICDVKKADEMWENAKKLAQTDSQLREIERSEICWQYWKCCRMKGEYSLFRGIYSYMKSRKDLYDKIVAFGITALGEGDIKYLREHAFSIYFMSPTKWESKYDGKFWHALDPYAQSFYEFVEAFH